MLIVRANALVLVLGVVGCGGATASDLFTNPPASNDAGVADTSNIPDSNVFDEGIGVDATPPPPPPPIDASPDVSPPPDPATIVCGASLASASLKCDPTNQVCCRAGGGSISASCTTISSCQQPNVSLACSTTNTCNQLGLVNNVCCGTLVNGPNNAAIVASAKCVPANQCPNGNGTIRLCDSKTNVCTNGLVCKTSSVTLPGYDLCLQP